ncbi:basic salivary proline-rich protein 1 [Periophthalmus magnuspinnatus]|uniref:basic salivary proline-rich protein 1 n=1 Tax=Periophthalmus magnuspinnatus TaxID=409849 RepID=UPI00145AEFBD|nr:basic salivary proline-rich protein 1 [Periophthalmus magnuspinnatus]
MADQGDPFTDDGESSEENSGPEMKKSVGLKELQVCVTDINLVQPSVTNGAPVKRGPGRPKGSVKSNINGGNTPKKRGRPKSSTVKVVAGDMSGGAAKRPRGRDTSGDETDDSFSPPRKRGRPKGSFKKPKYDTKDSIDNEAVQSTPKREKIPQQGAKKQEPAADGTQPSLKRPGRPKGSRNKPVFTVRVENTSGRPTRVHVPPDKLNISLPRKYPGRGRGRPKKSNRGRPRKRPLPPGEELYQPRVWKALGRPRKYPKEERPEQAPALDTPRRGRGRPRKSESKKGAHLRKLDSDGLPRKAEHPPKSAKEQDGPPRKRGRPKGSFKNKARIDNSSVKMSHVSDHSPEDENLEEDNIE